MLQECLNGLAMLHIHWDIEHSVEMVVDAFARQ